MFQKPLIALLLLGMLWKSADLVRMPRNRLLLMVTVSLALLTAGEALSLPAPTAAVDRLLTVGGGKILFNGVYALGLYTLVLVFLVASRDSFPGLRRRVRFDSVLVFAAIALLFASVALMPAAVRGGSLTSSPMRLPAVACFYIAGNTYFCYAYLAAGYYASRYAQLASRSLAWGLRIMALGLFVLTVTAFGRVSWIVLRIADRGPHTALNQTVWSMTDWAEGVVLIGVCYSGCEQLLRRWQSELRYRRMYIKLGPLWGALSTAFPELVLHKPPTGWRRAGLRPNGTHLRFYRRLIECRDGLVRLSPYLRKVAPDADLATGSPEQLARHLISALALKPPSEGPHVSLDAVPVALPADNDLDADARELIALSEALRKRVA